MFRLILYSVGFGATHTRTHTHKEIVWINVIHRIEAKQFAIVYKTPQPCIPADFDVSHAHCLTELLLLYRCQWLNVMTHFRQYHTKNTVRIWTNSNWNSVFFGYLVTVSVGRFYSHPYTSFSNYTATVRYQMNLENHSTLLFRCWGRFVGISEYLPSPQFMLMKHIKIRQHISRN